MEIKITRTAAPRPKPADPTKLGFGTVFTDHMFTMDYDVERGWHDAEIVPLQDLRIHPGAAVFHYGAEVFEGLKAYRTDDGAVQLFRPADNMQRMRDSAERIQLPDFDAGFMLEATLKLVELDQDWVPTTPSASLYIRRNISLCLTGQVKQSFSYLTLSCCCACLITYSRNCLIRNSRPTSQLFPSRSVTRIRSR